MHLNLKARVFVRHLGAVGFILCLTAFGADWIFSRMVLAVALTGVMLTRAVLLPIDRIVSRARVIGASALTESRRRHFGFGPGHPGERAAAPVRAVLSGQHRTRQ